jgi:TRAP-type C4-dicarboxylate transport system permease small subunit
VAELKRHWGRGLLFYMGAIGLATATVIDTVAVSGRWLSLPLHGALEIIQAAVLITACASMLTATLEESHASVHLLLNRVGPRVKATLKRVSSLIAATLFVGLTIASVWLVIEHWGGHEESELLHIPFRPLRLLCSVSMLLILIVFAWRTIKPRGDHA